MVMINVVIFCMVIVSGVLSFDEIVLISKFLRGSILKKERVRKFMIWLCIFVLVFICKMVMNMVFCVMVLNLEIIVNIIVSGN